MSYELFGLFVTEMIAITIKNVEIMTLNGRKVWCQHAQPEK